MKLVQEADCPHCKKKIELETDVENLKIDDKKVKTNSSVQQETVLEKPEVKEIVKEVVKLPSHIPSYKCKDGNCGRIHTNENYHTKIKAKCENCGQFTPDPSSPCLFCGQNEFNELDDEDLEDLGIPQPKEVEHDHETI